MSKFLTQSFLTVLLLLSVNLVKSQKTGTLSGMIVDKTSQKSVSNVSIQILNSTKGTISDSLGKFSISQLLSGAYTIQFKAIGYLTVTKYNVPVTSGNEKNLLRD